MKIVIDARVLGSSTGRYVERLLHYLQELDTTDEYVVLLKPQDAARWQPTNPHFSVVEADIKSYSFAEQWQLRKVLQRLSPDLVHFCMPQQPLWYKGTRVTTVHDLTLLKTYNSDKNWLSYHFKQLVGRYLFKSIAHSNRFILTPSLYTKEDYMKYSHIDPARVRVTYEAADPVRAHETPYEVPYAQYLLYVGQQSDYKNIKRLGDAHHILQRTYPDLGLVLVGKIDKAAEATRMYFEKKGYTNISFTGFVPDDKLAWLYSHARAYVFPSLMEGFGLPGLEAMIYGAPVVSSNATCLPEIYQDAAYYFDPYTAEDIARAINDVFTKSSLHDHLVARGYEQVTHYSWSRMAEQTLAIYHEALHQ